MCNDVRCNDATSTEAFNLQNDEKDMSTFLIPSPITCSVVRIRIKDLFLHASLFLYEETSI